MKKITEFRIHWITVTVWGSARYALELWERWFEEYLGSMVSTGLGGRGFELRMKALLSANLYLNPIIKNDFIDDHIYFSIDLPGQACDAVPDIVFHNFVRHLNQTQKDFRFTRLDLAWDGVNCHPEEFRLAVSEDRVRSYAKRESLLVNWSPFKQKDSGEIETMTVSLGARSSTRRIKFYDKRGFTRVELETKKERADAIGKEMLIEDPKGWPPLATAHLRDYIDIFETSEKVDLVRWWDDLVTQIARAKVTITDARTVELNRILEWIDSQVSPSLSVVADVVGPSSIDAFVISGRKKRGAKFNAILEMKKLKDELER